MSSEPVRVSVLLRTLDRPQLLARALKSVVAQTYAPIEILVCNDGGAPVGEVLQTVCTSASLGAQRSVRLIEWPRRRGRAHAANALLETASGEALLFLDDDDWLEPGHLASLVEALMAQPGAVAAYSAVRCVRRGEEGEWATVRTFDEPFDVERLGHENFLPIHSVLFRRAAVEAGCRFPLLDAFEDWAFWLQVARLGTFVHQPDLTAVYCLDASGFGCAAPDPASRRLQLLGFVRAVRGVWTDEQLAAMLDLYGWKARAQELEHRLETCSMRLETAQAQSAAARQAAGEAAAELRAVQNTLSWRITAPLRALRAAVRRR